MFQGHDEIHVRIWFHRRVARYVEESSWHASQKLTPQRDGSLIAEFDLSDGEEVKHWVLSFGKRAEILEPESLREEMLEEIAALHATYDGQSRQAAPRS